MSRYERFSQRYLSGDVPWDHADPPPEVRAFVPTLSVGRALDLGCGYGRAALFMGRLGWAVDGVDFVATAIAMARERAAAAGLAKRVRFHRGDVARLDFLTGPYDLAIDVGTMHSLDPAELRDYHAGLTRLLRPGAHYLLFAHLDYPGQAPEDERRWLDEALFLDLIAESFDLERAEHGRTQVADNPPWPSAWFWFRRRPADSARQTARPAGSGSQLLA